MKRLVALIVAGMAFAALTAGAADAKALYEEHCSKCHGKDGKGQTTMGKKYGAKDYTDAKVQEKVTDEAALKAVKDGFKSEDGKVLMKPADGLSAEDMKATVAYLRTFKK
jgi:cytochrome c553